MIIVRKKNKYKQNILHTGLIFFLSKYTFPNAFCEIHENLYNVRFFFRKTDIRHGGFRERKQETWIKTTILSIIKKIMAKSNPYNF